MQRALEDLCEPASGAVLLGATTEFRFTVMSPTVGPSLLGRETGPHNWLCEVTVEGESLRHVSQVPVSSPVQEARVRQVVFQAQTLATDGELLIPEPLERQRRGW